MTYQIAHSIEEKAGGSRSNHRRQGSVHANARSAKAARADRDLRNAGIVPAKQAYAG
jgi:hypothetical protein